MPKRRVIVTALAAAVLAPLGFGAWVWTLPPDAAPVTTAAPPEEEADALLASLRPPKRARPVIAVIGLNDATETTDYLMPTGILRRADVADVVMVATGPGPVRLYPALRVEPDMTTADFDAAYPKGADYVIVPAMSRDDDPDVLAWLQRQAAGGATIVGICAGAKVVGAAGLLDGRRATTHWYYVDEMLGRSPTIQYVADRRIVADENIVTTTGISASMPMTLTLIEAIGGRETAQSVARAIGLERWDARHASAAFKVTRRFATTVLVNRAIFWRHEDLGIRLEPGMDEASLALMADAWSRTYRSDAVTLAASAEAVATANGIRVVPDRIATDWPADRRLSTLPNEPPSATLERALRAIAGRYGERTRQMVAMQLEYPQ
ncbi:DJ-1/PfpI family protein [Faunimonas sp. B44]|uniref:DJ-1/PfpI family protein n=1 Tax=Faunimonas sp. B44 TaxID=3461493 RepID=UPI00404484DC